LSVDLTHRQLKKKDFFFDFASNLIQMNWPKVISKKKKTKYIYSTLIA